MNRCRQFVLTVQEVSFQDLTSADYSILEQDCLQSKVGIYRCRQFVLTKLPPWNSRLMQHWPAFQTTATSKNSRRRFGLHVLDAFKLSRARFLQAI